jgi:hypothetical protein
MSDKETLAQWMMQHGYATGHGDTMEDLLVELDIQIVENWTRALVNGVQGEREACAALCDKIADDDGFEGGYADYCAISIRARGQG